MTRFKAKLRKIGNSLGVLIPIKVITGYSSGDVITLDVITEGEKDAPKVITKEKTEEPVITPKKSLPQSNRYEMCEKHPGSMKITCGCK